MSRSFRKELLAHASVAALSSLILGLVSFVRL
jgi:hypothetical protein